MIGSRFVVSDPKVIRVVQSKDKWPLSADFSSLWVRICVWEGGKWGRIIGIGRIENWSEEGMRGEKPNEFVWKLEPQGIAVQTEDCDSAHFFTYFRQKYVLGQMQYAQMLRTPKGTSTSTEGAGFCYVRVFNPIIQITGQIRIPWPATEACGLYILKHIS